MRTSIRRADPGAPRPAVPSSPATHPTAGPRADWRGTVGASLAAAAIVTLLAALFLWPVRAATPTDLPLVLAGPPQARQLVERQLRDAGAPFRTEQAADRDAALRSIRERAAYGGIVVTLAGPAGSQAAGTPARPGSPAPGAPAAMSVDVEILTASAAAPAVAQALTQAGAHLPAAPAPGVTMRVRTTDVVPLAATDPRGAGIGMLALPLGIGGLVVGVLVALRVRGRAPALTALVAAAALAGLAWTLLLNPWFGLLTGSFWAEWGIATLAVAATAAFAAGAHALLGIPGLALAGLVTTPFGFPLAGTQLPREFLPAPWGDVGQALVPGASATALRVESYFPDASLGTPLTVLTIWLVAGLVCLALGRGRAHRPDHR